MGSEWTTRPLSEVARDVTVGFVGTMVDQYVAEGVPFLRSLNVKPFEISLDDVRYISPEFHKKLRKSALSPGDVVIVRTGKPGICAVVPESLPTANCSDVVIVRCGSELRPRFLCYWINAMASSHVSAHTVGAVQQHFNVASAKQIRLPVPPLVVQDQVLEPLLAMDARIELLRQTNVTIEAIVQAQFKSWFIDFDPVRAKSEGREPEGVDAATAALFPRKFDESPLGLIPNGWQVGSVGDVVKCVGGGTPDTKNLPYWEPAEYAWTTPKDLSGLQSPVLTKTERMISAEGLAKVSSGLLPAGTLLMSSRAPIGYLALATIRVAVNQGYIAMLPGGRLSPLYLYFWCKRNMSTIKGNANGSTFMEISKKAFRPLQVLLPSEDVLLAFQRIADPLFARLAENERQSQTLSALRDTLLPKLISGQLQLPDAEQIAGETR